MENGSFVGLGMGGRADPDRAPTIPKGQNLLLFLQSTLCSGREKRLYVLDLQRNVCIGGGTVQGHWNEQIKCAQFFRLVLGHRAIPLIALCKPSGQVAVGVGQSHSTWWVKQQNRGESLDPSLLMEALGSFAKPLLQSVTLLDFVGIRLF